MDRTVIIVSLVALLVGLAAGAGLMTWWEGGRQAAALDTLRVRQADEQGQAQAKIKELTDELAGEQQRVQALERIPAARRR